jgi:hypothetical protein
MQHLAVVLSETGDRVLQGAACMYVCMADLFHSYEGGLCIGNGAGGGLTSAPLAATEMGAAASRPSTAGTAPSGMLPASPVRGV